MLDREKLIDCYTRKGYNRETFCNAIGIDKSTFWRKTSGVSSFTLDEVDDIASLLNISGKKVKEIFFCSSVAEKQQEKI